MFEMMLMGGVPSKIQYPDSGPGPKTLLFGDESLGYFGEVTSDIFLTIPELQSQLNFYAGGSIPDPNVSWAKVFSEGKILYIPKRAIVNSIPWNTLYNAGLVYGVDGVGFSPTATPTNQLRTVTVANRQFKVRLLKGATTDTGPYLSWSSPTVQSAEWPKLAVAMITQASGDAGAPKWNIYTNTTTLFTGNTDVYTQNSVSNARRLTLSFNSASQDLPTATKHWFPTLELIPLE